MASLKIESSALLDSQTISKPLWTVALQSSSGDEATYYLAQLKWLDEHTGIALIEDHSLFLEEVRRAPKVFLALMDDDGDFFGAQVFARALGRIHEVSAPFSKAALELFEKHHPFSDGDLIVVSLKIEKLSPIQINLNKSIFLRT